MSASGAPCVKNLSNIGQERCLGVFDPGAEPAPYGARGAVIFTDFGFAAGPLGSDAQGKNGVPSGNIAVFRA